MNKAQFNSKDSRRATTRRILTALTSLTLCVGALSASAGDFSDVKKLSQEAFSRLAKDLASVTALRALSPGVTLNLLGFDVGAELGVSKVNNGDEWKRAGGGSTDVVTPRVSIHKGLAAGVDIGASLGVNTGSGVQTLGGILRYQLADPGVLTPGATLRLTANREVGASSVNVRNFGADLVVAKPLVVITPYVGAGLLRSESRAPGTTLADVSVSRSRVFVGFDTRLAFATVSAEAERVGDVTTVSSKIGFRF